MKRKRKDLYYIKKKNLSFYTKRHKTLKNKNQKEIFANYITKGSQI